MAERLVETIAAGFAAVRPGPSWDAASAYSPIVSARQLAQVDRIVAEAREAGGRVLAGGRPMQTPGWFYEPTLIDQVGPDSPAVRSEIFGPVLTVQTFVDEQGPWRSPTMRPTALPPGSTPGISRVRSG